MSIFYPPCMQVQVLGARLWSFSPSQMKIAHTKRRIDGSLAKSLYSLVKKKKQNKTKQNWTYGFKMAANKLLEISQHQLSR